MACFQLVLDKGQEDDWFELAGHHHDVQLSVIPALVAFFLWEWYHEHPIVDVRLLKNRNFGDGGILLFCSGNGVVRLYRV